MYKKNMGQFDRAVRFVVGVTLVVTGLFVLDGAQGNAIGIFAVVFALLPFLTSVTGFCPLYVPFEISTLRGDQSAPKTSQL